jgi:hypothetical protein
MPKSLLRRGYTSADLVLHYSSFLFFWSLSVKESEERYATGWANCIRVMLDRFRSGHAVHSRIQELCQMCTAAEWWLSLRLQWVKGKTPRTPAKLELKASAEGCPQSATVIGCFMSRRRSRFIRKGMNYRLFHFMLRYVASKDYSMKCTYFQMRRHE